MCRLRMVAAIAQETTPQPHHATPTCVVQWMQFAVGPTGDLVTLAAWAEISFAARTSHSKARATVLFAFSQTPVIGLAIPFPAPLIVVGETGPRGQPAAFPAVTVLRAPPGPLLCRAATTAETAVQRTEAMLRHHRIAILSLVLSTASWVTGSHFPFAQNLATEGRPQRSGESSGTRPLVESPVPQTSQCLLFVLRGRAQLTALGKTGVHMVNAAQL